MYTMSTVTALAEMDPSLGDDTEIANQISILVAIQGNGTLLSPTSFKEENTLKLYVGLGQEHAEGVLQPLETKTVLTFQSNSDMMATMCHLTVATVWHIKPIKLHIQPQISMQVRDYIAAGGSHPSGAQVHVQGGSGCPTSPSEPHLGDGPWPELTRVI